MRLGYHTGYWSAGPPPGAQEAVLGAEQLGFDSVWTAEAYGSDALTPLAWWGVAHVAHPARHGDRADLRAHPDGRRDGRPHARPPLRAAGSSLGLGASGPQVVEGWYGQPYPRPLARTREYVVDRPPGAGARGARDVRRAVLPAAAAGPTRAPGWARRCARPCTRCAPTCRSTSPPRGPRTSRCRRRSPTAGCRCSTRRAWTASTGRCWPTASRRRAPGLQPGRRSSRSSPPCPVVLGADVEPRRRQRPAVHRAVRRAAWAPRAPTSTAPSSTGSATPRRATRSRRTTSPATAPAPTPRCRSSWCRTSPSSGTVDDIRAQLPAWESTAVTTMLVQADPRTLPAIADALRPTA